MFILEKGKRLKSMNVRDAGLIILQVKDISCMNIQNIKDKVNTFFTKGNERSVTVKKNIAASLVLKCISILISLQIVPLTIDYVNPTKGATRIG